MEPAIELTVGAALTVMTLTRPSAGVASAVTPEPVAGDATTVTVPAVLPGVPVATVRVAETTNGFPGHPCGMTPLDGQSPL